MLVGGIGSPRRTRLPNIHDDYDLHNVLVVRVDKGDCALSDNVFISLPHSLDGQLPRYDSHASMKAILHRRVFPLPFGNRGPAK